MAASTAGNLTAYRAGSREMSAQYRTLTALYVWVSTPIIRLASHSIQHGYHFHTEGTLQQSWLMP